jgi:hypothetical protein
MSKKMKITIECEGKETKVFEANGIAAAMLTDGKDSDHWGSSILICGNMSVQDLINLHGSVGKELIGAVEGKILGNLSVTDLIKILWGDK